jgi:hypothetical protein
VAKDLLARAEALAGERPSTVARFRAMQRRLSATQERVDQAREMVSERRRNHEEYTRAQAAFEIIRNPQSADHEVVAACEEVYWLDPRVFARNAVNCRNLFRENPRWFFQLQASASRSAPLTDRLSVAAESAASVVQTVETRLDEAENSIDDDLRGKRAYLYALIVGSLTCCVILLLLLMRVDVREAVFRNVQATELVTVLLVVMAVIYFGSIRTLSGESVAGLLGGIAGYVLGRQRGAQRTGDEALASRAGAAAGAGDGAGGGAR